MSFCGLFGLLFVLMSAVCLYLLQPIKKAARITKFYTRILKTEMISESMNENTNIKGENVNSQHNGASTSLSTERNVSELLGSDDFQTNKVTSDNDNVITAHTSAPAFTKCSSSHQEDVKDSSTDILFSEMQTSCCVELQNEEIKPEASHFMLNKEEIFLEKSDSFVSACEERASDSEGLSDSCMLVDESCDGEVISESIVCDESVNQYLCCADNSVRNTEIDSENLFDISKHSSHKISVNENLSEENIDTGSEIDSENISDEQNANDPDDLEKSDELETVCLESFSSDSDLNESSVLLEVGGELVETKLSDILAFTCKPEYQEDESNIDNQIIDELDEDLIYPQNTVNFSQKHKKDKLSTKSHERSEIAKNIDGSYSDENDDLDIDVISELERSSVHEEHYNPPNSDLDNVKQFETHKCNVDSVSESSDTKPLIEELSYNTNPNENLHSLDSKTVSQFDTHESVDDNTSDVSKSVTEIMTNLSDRAKKMSFLTLRREKMVRMTLTLTTY